MKVKSKNDTRNNSEGSEDIFPKVMWSMFAEAKHLTANENIGKIDLCHSDEELHSKKWEQKWIIDRVCYFQSNYVRWTACGQASMSIQIECINGEHIHLGEACFMWIPTIALADDCICWSL